MISRDETERLAAMANALRPDWPLKSLTTFIVNELTRRTYREVAIALAWIATDPATDTPKRMLEAGPWWNASRAQAATVSVVVTRCAVQGPRTPPRCPLPCLRGSQPRRGRPRRRGRRRPRGAAVGSQVRRARRQGRAGS
jgi:hypothetical protein